ncbi:MAG: hypothetical protein ACLU0V_00285 [Eggerthella lenta]
MTSPSLLLNQRFSKLATISQSSVISPKPISTPERYHCHSSV